MKQPAAKLHRPVEALRRLQLLAGCVRMAAGDRNPNRAAQLEELSRQIFDLAMAALSGGPLPEPPDWREKI